MTITPMAVGYPCINNSIGCTANSTFRLRSYTEERFTAFVASNLHCLQRILDYNREHGLLFFRIGSGLIPFASHPVCSVNWRKMFRKEFQRIGSCIRENGMRISMHPDQFLVLNSPDPGVVSRSLAELRYHCEVLDALGLDADAKVQIHCGGVYGDKPAALTRLIDAIRRLPSKERARLVIENDDRCFSNRDCLGVSAATGVPVLFDVFHHHCLNNGESVADALRAAARTWTKTDGTAMVDYSEQEPGARKGSHARTLSPATFAAFARACAPFHCAIMLEIKDKEISGLKAVRILNRLQSGRRGVGS